MNYTVSENESGARLDLFISETALISRSAAQKLIEKGCVTVNGQPTQKKYLTREGDTVAVDIPKPEECEAKAENIPLDILFEDSDIIIINKPSGMVVHPAPSNYSGTLVNALLYHAKDSLSGIGGVIRPGIVHRIDKDTSGLLVVAKNDAAHAVLADQLSRHEVEREYHALVRGGFKADAGTVDAPIGRHPEDRKKMAVLKGSELHAREAVTHYEVLERFGDISYVKCLLETGRTHQIRVHMAYIGHALLGDEVYAGSKTVFEKKHPPLFDGQMLHAKRLTLTHPTTKERLTFECPLPENFEKCLQILRSERE